MNSIYLNFIYWFIGECIATLRGHDDEVLDVVFDSTGQYIATASADKTGRVYDGLTQLCIATLTGHQAEISKVKFFFERFFEFIYLFF